MKGGYKQPVNIGVTIGGGPAGFSTTPRPINPAIVKEMVDHMGYDRKTITASILNGRYDDCAATYYLLYANMEESQRKKKAQLALQQHHQHQHRTTAIQQIQINSNNNNNSNNNCNNNVNQQQQQNNNNNNCCCCNLPKEFYQSILRCKVRDISSTCMNGNINIKSGRRTKKRWIVLVKGCISIYKSKKNDELPINIIPLYGKVYSQLLGSIPSLMSSYSLSQSYYSFSAAITSAEYFSSSSSSQLQHYSVHSTSPSSLSLSSASSTSFVVNQHHSSVASPTSVSPMQSVNTGSSPHTPVTIASPPPPPPPPTITTPPSRLSSTNSNTVSSSSSSSTHHLQNGKQFYFKLENAISYSLDSDGNIKENGPEQWVFFTENSNETIEWVSLINSAVESFSQLVPNISTSSISSENANISVVASKTGALSSSSSSSSASTAHGTSSPSPRPTITSTSISNSNILQKEQPPKPIFGKSIDEIMDRQMEEGTMSIIPDFLHSILSHLEKTSTEIEGIFRVSGSEQEVLYIQHELEEGHSVDFSTYSPHTLTSFVKAFFQSLPEPIIPPKLNKVLDNTLKKAEFETRELPDDYCEMINQTLVNKLSMSSMALLKELVRLFNKIVEKSSINKMTLDNLFIVILPTLQCAPSVLAAMMAKPNALLGSDLFGSNFM